MDKSTVFKSEPPLTQAVQAPLRRINSDETERPPSAQQTQDEDNEHTDANEEAQPEDEDSDLAESVVDFDWDDLHRRYHEVIKTCHGKEAELMQEWESLMAVLHPPYSMY